MFCSSRFPWFYIWRSSFGCLWTAHCVHLPSHTSVPRPPLWPKLERLGFGKVQLGGVKSLGSKALDPWGGARLEKQEMSGWNPPNYRTQGKDLCLKCYSLRDCDVLSRILCGTERHVQKKKIDICLQLLEVLQLKDLNLNDHLSLSWNSSRLKKVASNK